MPPSLAILALALLVGGLVVVWLSTSVKQPLLAAVVYWTGIVLVVVGLILLISPVILWINAQLQSMLGV